MANKISSRDLFEKEDIFKGVRDSADKTITKLDKFKTELKGIATESKKAFGSLKLDNAKGINDLIKLVDKANKVNQEAISIDKARKTALDQKNTAEKQLIQIEREKEKLSQEQLKTARLKAQADKRENTERRKKIKAIEQENDAYKKLSKNTRDLKNESKRLGAEMILLEQSGKKNTKAYIQLEQQYRKVTKSARAGDQQLKKLDKTVGDNFRNVGNYKNALAGLKNGLGQLGLAMGVGQIFRLGGEAIVEFNQAVADLSAITGASGEDLEFYKRKANELGVEVEGGASAVVEAYKLIGSAKPELLSNAKALNELTESAITLSQASGLTLPEASKNLTDAMNQFGASSEEAGKFIDVLASGSKFGSAEIPLITEALLKFGAIAKSTNVSIQESTASIELLAENGLKGAEAGTKLRNVMLKLSAPDALPKKARDIITELGISFEDISDQSKPFEERLEALKPLLEDNAGMVEVFGIQNVVAGNILLSNTERLSDLTEKMDTNGVANEQAEKRTNTLGNALMKLKNSFIGLFTEIASGDGALQGWIDGLKWVAKNLPRIISVVGKLIKIYVTYRLTVMALNGVQKLYTIGIQGVTTAIAKQIPFTKAYTREQLKANATTKNGTSATNGFRGSIVSLIATGVVMFLYSVAQAWYDVASGNRDATQSQIAYNEAKSRGTDKAQVQISESRKAMEQEVRNLRKLGLTETELAEEKDKIQEKYIKKNQEQIDAINKQKGALKGQQQTLAMINRLADKGNPAVISLEEKGLKAQKKIEGLIKANNLQKVQAEVSRLATEGSFKRFDRIAKAGIKELETQAKALQEQQSELNAELEDSIIQQIDYKKTQGTVVDVQIEFNTALQDTNKYLSKQRQLLQDIQQIQDKRVIEKLDRDIDKEFDTQIKNIQETGEFDATSLNNLLEQKADLEQKFIEDRVKFDKESVDLRIKATNEKELKALEKQRDTLLAQSEITDKAKTKINNNFDDKKKELEDEQEKRLKDGETEKVKIYENGQNEILAIDRKKKESLKKNAEDLADEVEEFDEKVSDDELEKIKDREQQKRDIYKLTADYFIKQSEKRIKQIEDELKKAQDQQTFLQDLAKNGNIKAEQSLAENQKIIEEANRKKEAELKKQERIRLAESVYSTYSSKVEAQVDNPLMETIRDVTLLQSFINSLPAFHDGTEDTGSNGRGIDGKGGFQAVLHPNERVIPKALNDQIGSMSNEDLTRLAIQYQNEGIIRGKIQTERSDMTLLVSEVKDLKQVIQDKPEFSAEVGKITQTSFEILERTKTKNTTVYNRFNIKA